MKKNLFIAFLVLVIDFISFGILIPILPYFSKHLGSSSLELGILLSSFSFMQFIFSPFWGRMSDLVGRRPIFLITLFGTVLSHVLFALSSSYWFLLLARALSGFFGANVSTVQSMIADITEEKNRSKNMGLIGAAIGLGFFLGPFLGGVLAYLEFNIPFVDHSAYAAPALGAALFSFIAFVVCYFFLKETYFPAKQNKTNARKENLFFQLRKIMKANPFRARILSIKSYFHKPRINKLLFIQLFFQTAFSCMEVGFFLFVMDVFQINVREASFGFAYIGLVVIFTNGFLVRKLIPWLGERNNILLGLCMGILSFYFLSVSDDIFPDLILSLTLLGCSCIVMPSILGTISLLSPKNSQGEALGVNQSMAAVGRILGPIVGGILHGEFSHQAPFLFSSFIVGVGLVIFLSDFKKWPDKGRVVVKPV